jgi:predicted  nucleic acid-binding Zn-ribbon protein
MQAGQLESEAQQLRHTLAQKQNHSNMLEQRVVALENELTDMQTKVSE